MTWPTKKLGEVLEINDAGVWGKPSSKGKGIFVLRSTNFDNEGLLDFSDVPELEIPDQDLVKLQDGDILLEKSGGGPEQPVGRVTYFVAPDERSFTFANFIQRLRPKDKLVLGRFLFYHLLNLHKTGFTKRLQSQTTGIRNLKLSLYFKHEIPLAPVPIQKKVVERLDTIVEAQKVNNGLVERVEELFKSLLVEVFSQGKLERIGRYLVVLDRGISWSQKNEVSSNQGTPVLGIPNIKSGNIDARKVKRLDKSPDNFKLKEGDIVLVASNGNPKLVGRSALVTLNEAGMLFASFLVRIRTNTDKLLPRYMHLFLLTPLFKKELRRQISTTSGIYNLRKEHIEKINIPILTLSEQNAVINKLSAVQEYKKQLLLQKDQLKDLFDSVLQKSMKGEMDGNR